MKKLLSIAAICSAVILGAGAAAPAAHATTVTATFTGTMVSAGDYGHQFGDFNAGDAFTLKAVFDDTVGTLSGGTITGGGSATLSIGGHSYTFSLGDATLGINQYGSLVMSINDSSTGQFVQADFWSPTAPTNLYTAFSGDTAPGYSFGDFETVPGYSGSGMIVDHLTLAATPIPAALPLFASSLLGLGFVGWKRRKANAAA
jgi:hypothetical protein